MSMPRGSGTILVADDHTEVRNLTARILEMAGYDVVTAIDAPSTLAVFEKHVEDVRLVLLDLSMPGAGAGETVAGLRKLKPEIPVFLITGYSEVETREQLGGHQITGWIEKPFKPMELLARIRKTLDGTQE